MSSAKSMGIKLRFVTEITEGNISQCKEVVTTGEIRHLEGVKGNFAVSDTEYIAISSAAITASSTTTRNGTGIATNNNGDSSTPCRIQQCERRRTATAICI